MSADKTIKTGFPKRRDAERSGREPDGHVSNALRSAYEEAVREEIPAEFLDLLGKLT